MDPVPISASKTLVLANEPADFTISKSPVLQKRDLHIECSFGQSANIKNYTWTIGGLH